MTLQSSSRSRYWARWHDPPAMRSRQFKETSDECGVVIAVPWPKEIRKYASLNAENAVVVPRQQVMTLYTSEAADTSGWKAEFCCGLSVHAEAVDGDDGVSVIITMVEPSSLRTLRLQPNMLVGCACPRRWNKNAQRKLCVPFAVIRLLIQERQQRRRRHYALALSHPLALKRFSRSTPVLECGRSPTRPRHSSARATWMLAQVFPLTHSPENFLPHSMSADSRACR